MTQMCFLQKKSGFDGKDHVTGACMQTNGIDVLGLRGTIINDLYLGFDDFMNKLPSNIDNFINGKEKIDGIVSFDLGINSIVRIDTEKNKVMLDRKDKKEYLTTGWRDITDRGIVVMPPGQIFEPSHVHYSYVSKSHGRNYSYIYPVKEIDVKKP